MFSKILGPIQSVKSRYSGINIIFLIVILFAEFNLAQTPDWTSVKETNINVGFNPFDIFTNKDGNHIIVQESSSLKYYKMNVSGTAGSPITLESSSVISPSIAGDNNRIYVVYRKGTASTLTAKYSTNGGNSWSYISSNPTNSNASSIEAVMSNGKLHVTYQVSSTVLYRYWTGTAWSSEKTVSTGETGTYPRIAAWYYGGEDKVYFIYRNTTSTSKWREYNVTNNSWGNIQTAFTHSNSLPPVGIAVDANYVYAMGNYLTGGSTFNFICYITTVRL